MKTSEALRCTKAWVWSGTEDQEGEERYCCLAAARCGSTVHSIVRPILCDLLEGYAALETWIVNRTGETLDTLFDGNEKMQITRHAWLDHLIAHYESMGD